MRSRPLLLLVVAGTAIVWAASAELRWPARALLSLLLLPLPFVMVQQTRMLEHVGALPRVPVYLSSAIAQWLLAGVTVLLALVSGFTPLALGLGAPHSWLVQLAWGAGLTVAGVSIMLASHALGIRESGLLAHLLPRTRAEKTAFVGLSITAGVCEEVVFRGFLIAALLTATASLPLALLLSSLAFGMVHAYQEPGGVARATLLGLLLAAPLVLTGSLAGAILAHTAIDVIGGLWLGERLTR
jgi:uncharacterized protein